MEDIEVSRVDFGAKPLMYPQPVLIIGTYDENGVPNAMNAAWGITTDFKEITISLSALILSATHILELVKRLVMHLRME